HFDDNISQKYLLEAIGAPMVPSYVFYDKKEAIEWAHQVSFPKVFKLKGGSGSANLQLVETINQCLQLINKAFGKASKQFDGNAHFFDATKKCQSGAEYLKQRAKALGRMASSTAYG